MSFSAHRRSWVNKRLNKRLNDVSAILQNSLKRRRHDLLSSLYLGQEQLKEEITNPNSRGSYEKKKRIASRPRVNNSDDYKTLGILQMDFAQFTNFGVLRCIVLRCALYKKPLAYTTSRTLDQSNYPALMVKELSRNIKIVYFRM